MSPRSSGRFVVPKTQISKVNGNSANGVMISTESFCVSVTWTARLIGLAVEIFVSCASFLRNLIMELLNIVMNLSIEFGVISMSSSLV